MEDQETLKNEISRLQSMHTQLDEELARLMMNSVPDHLHIQRVKKEKLRLKDKIGKVRSKLVPDIIA